MSAIPHNLSPQLTPFVGRTRELADLVGKLQRADCRLLTLVGPGGMGKTRLALEVAQQIVNPSPISNLHFPDGVFFVSLAPVTSPTLLAPTIASTIGVELHGSDSEQALVKSLTSKRMLLIVDNFEHLLAGAGLVAQIIQYAPAVQIMITSRARLNLQGERVYQVPPLAVVESLSLESLSLEDVMNSDAVRLFVQRTQRSQPAFSLHAGNLTAILQICRLVEGMPLGLEMAAAWSEWLPVSEIATEIAKSSDFLALDWIDAPPRQRSMRAVFEWSWKLLNESEQEVFRLLSIFRGGFARQAAEQVTGASMRTLISLTNKSLLIVTYPQEGVVRYHVHELLRQFAEEQLHASGEADEIALRHSDYYLSFVADSYLRLGVAEIQTELDNIRQAWLCATAHADSQLLDKSVVGLSHYYDTTGLLNERIDRLGETAAKLEMAATSGKQEAAHYQQTRSKLLALQAATLVKQVKLIEGMNAAQQAVDLGVRYACIEGETYGHAIIGQVLMRQGDYQEARQSFERVLQMVVQQDQQSASLEMVIDAEWIAYAWLGAIESELGNYAQAKSHFHTLIAISGKRNDPLYDLVARMNLADVLRRASEYQAARPIYEQSLKLAQSLGYQWGEAQTQLELGDTIRLLGEYSLANQLLLQAEARHSKIETTLDRVHCHVTLARLHSCLGDNEQARQWLDRVFASPLLHTSALHKFFALSARSIFSSHSGDFEVSLRNAGEIVQLGQQLSNLQFQAEGLLLLGHAQRALQHFADAEQSYQTAHRLYLQIGNHTVAAEARAGVAISALHRGDIALAQQLIEELLPLLTSETPVGLDEPFFVYLTCYQVLAGVQDVRAERILQQGYTLLERYANQIHDDGLRHSFREHVPLHRALRQAYLVKRVAA